MKKFMWIFRTCKKYGILPYQSLVESILDEMLANDFLGTYEFSYSSVINYTEGKTQSNLKSLTNK